MSVTTHGLAGTGSRPAGSPGRIDPRGPRFAATLTTVVLAVALLLVVHRAHRGAAGRAGRAVRDRCLRRASSTRRTAGCSARSSGRASARRASSRTPPRRGSPRPSASGFAVVALAGYLTGAALLGAVATGLALAAAFLNAAFGFCLGCEIYLLAKRAAPARRHPLSSDHPSTDHANTPGRPSNERNRP